MASELPFFSIIIPTYGRPQHLRRCLESIEGMDYPKTRFEVIVVNDGFEPAPEDITSLFQSRMDVKLTTQKHAGPGAARNTGTSAAKGEYFAFTDDDCIVSELWLRNLAARFQKAEVCMIGGRTLNGLPDNPYAAASQAIVDVVYSYYNASSVRESFLVANNLSLPAEGFRKMGGFNKDFITAEDREFCDRWLHAGFPIYYAPEAVLYHAQSLNLRSLCKQHFNYGRGAFLFHHVRSGRGWGKLKPDLHFYRSLFRYPLSQNGTSPFVLYALFLACQMANAAGFVLEALRSIA
jgi:GT2 family glycosyltransferase